jgi:spore germination protein YaaH
MVVSRVLKDMTLVKRILFHVLIGAVGLLIIFNSFPIFAFAASDDEDDAELEVAGWIPYWADSRGIKDATKNISDIDIVFPFAYTMQSDGTIKDQAGLSDREWKKFIKLARSKDVEVIPTVMTSDGGSVHANLSYKDLRKKHIDNIMKEVKKHNFDGIDIDYEEKLSSTKDHFSAFLKELKKELDEEDKLLTCTVEARTPPSSLYKEVPKVIEYANDYEAIGKYCDRVEIMAYDQQRADLKLNESKAGEPYFPVSDVDWVEKVIKLALEDIPEDKILLGVPTYGYHYEVTVAPNWFSNYKRIGALNIPDILEVAEEYDVEPGRNKAGEMSYTYFPKSSPYKVLNTLPTPKGTTKGNEAAAKALLYANATGQTVNVRYVGYSDAEAIAQKIELAKEYGLKGIAVFKFDGEEDKNIWKLID